MNEEIKKIRKSIAKRSRLREYPSVKKDDFTKNNAEFFPQEEEKHGYFPIHQGNTPSKGNSFPYKNTFMIKGILSFALFLMVFIISSINHSFLKPTQNWLQYFLKEDFPFATVHQWYNESLGEPFVFTSQMSISSESMKTDHENAWPVEGKITETFQDNGLGVLISPKVASTVNALESGLVVFIGNDRTLGRKIVIQHPDRSRTTYGYLSSTDVHLYQFIHKSQRIGTFEPTGENKSVFFSIEKNQQFIDPIQVIKVDDFS